MVVAQQMQWRMLEVIKKIINEWEKLGNKGWGYNEILKYFIKSEHNENIK